MNYQGDLNPEQTRVIQSTGGVILVVSGPGTGKTTTIQHYIAQLITNRGIKPEEILAVSFTNKAAAEMKKRVEKMTGLKPVISTIHSFAAGVLKKFPPRGYSHGFRIADDKTQFVLTAELARRLGIKDHPSYIMEHMTLARNLRDKKILVDEGLEEFYRLYMKDLMEKGLMDYDGLLTWCAHVFATDPQAGEFYQSQYRYLLVDEFQDVSPIQYQILRHLVQKQGNFLAVGDFDQSIYRFRGADLNIMLNLSKDFPLVATLFLERNYRSTAKIIQAANRLIKNNLNRKDKPLWTENTAGTPHQVLTFPGDREEAAGIAERIQKGIKEGKKFSDFAVLYRVHILSRVFEEVFANLQIPYQIMGGTGYFQRAEVQSLLAFFRLIKEPQNPEAVKKVRLILALCPDLKLLDLVDQCAGQRSLEAIYDLILESTGYIGYLQKDKSREGERRLDSVEELRSLLIYFDEKNKTVDDLLGFIETTRPENGGKDAVRLMTAHAAKGLEFDTVFLAGAQKGMFPYYSNREKNEDIEEERRLFYVAVTRAKNTLYLTYPIKKLIKGKELKVQPSPFIDEMRLPPEVATASRITSSGITAGGMSKDEISEGSSVTHSCFGRGTVTEIIENPRETLVTVDFIKYGMKTLILEYAVLKPCD